MKIHEIIKKQRKSVSLGLVERIQAETPLPPMPHLTCIGQSDGDLKTILDHYRHLGIENVLALRGDFPQGTSESDFPEDCLTCAKDLVDLAATYQTFSIGVACYPREFAIEQCADLIKQGIRNFHFYTMNQVETVIDILGSLSLGRHQIL